MRSACLPGDGPQGVCEDLLYEDQAAAVSTQSYVGAMALMYTDNQVEVKYG